MSLHTPDLEVEIAVSNMDLYPADLPGRASWGSGLEEMIPYLEQTGCRNFEVVPTGAIIRDVIDSALGKGTGPLPDVIGSVHQSFNEGNGGLSRIYDWRGIPRSEQSLSHMHLIASAVGHRIPGVEYPGKPSGGELRTAEAIVGSTVYHGVVQPCAEVYHDLGVTHDSDLVSALALRGIKGLCPDTVHARRRAKTGQRPPAIEESWASQFSSGYVYQMHVGADRVDMARRDPELAERSGNEFKAFTARNWQAATRTEMSDMIVAAIEHWIPPADLAARAGRQVLRMVLEIPPRPQAMLHRVRQHARFVENLAEVVREAGASPLLWQD